MTTRIERSWPAAAVYLGILMASTIPGSALSATPAWMSVAGHFCEYALLATTLRRALPAARSRGFVVVVVGLTLGVVNELQQSAVPGRTPDVADLAVDGLGILAALTVAGTWARSRLPVS